MSEALFPPIEPHLRDHLAVGDGHRLYYELSGNPSGRPIVFLHGGPGGSTAPAHRRFFDPACWRIVLFDQRGCGQSTPLGHLRANDTQQLIGDLERLREHLGIERWALFAGSWGSTLGLAYAGAHPRRVAALLLRGIFLASPAELSWFLGELRAFLPEAWERLAAPVSAAAPPAGGVRELIARYHAEVMQRERAPALAAAQRWHAYESAAMAVGEAPSAAPAPGEEVVLARVRVQLHYLAHDFFLAPNALLEGATRLPRVPTLIVQGRRDLVCPPRTAYTLAQRIPGARLHMVEEGGHSAMHPAMSAALVRATEELKQLA